MTLIQGPIHLYSHKLQLQKQETKKQRKKIDAQRVKEHNVSINAHQPCSAKHKIT